MAKAKDEHTQGGGYHGAPKRWTGTGPRPARHIPWPELFKHHTSVLTGHLKMMDMVRKHCAPGSGNYETADACVNRIQEMLRDFKKATFSFVPPKDNIDRVPLGASSASMYPGYSPADHIYGEAAQEFGTQVAQMRKSGKNWEPQPNGPEYVVGQSKVSSKQQAELYEKHKSQNTLSESKPSDQPAQSEEYLWFVDSNPTPVNVTDASKPSKKEKRRTSNDAEDEQPVDEVLQKKMKSKASSQDARTLEEPPLEEDDIAGEVEARLKAKEEKRKKKEDKKRKRESADSSTLAKEPSTGDCMKADKPKKKKQKSQELEAQTETPTADGTKLEKKSKKDRKKRENTDIAGDEAKDNGEKRKKKRKKDI